MRLNETRCTSIFHICKYLSDTFHVHNGLKQGDALESLLFNFVLKCTLERSTNIKGIETEWGTSSSGLRWSCLFMGRREGDTRLKEKKQMM
jgi:hypothetical protein